MMKMGTVRDPPSGRVPERAPGRFLVAAEACGGRTPNLGYDSGVSVFIGIFGVGLTSWGTPSRPRDRGRAQGGRACPPPSVGLRLKIIKIWHVNWTPFGIPFL